MLNGTNNTTIEIAVQRGLTYSNKERLIHSARSRNSFSILHLGMVKNVHSKLGLVKKKAIKKVLDLDIKKIVERS